MPPEPALTFRLCCGRCGQVDIICVTPREARAQANPGTWIAMTVVLALVVVSLTAAWLLNDTVSQSLVDGQVSQMMHGPLTHDGGARLVVGATTHVTARLLLGSRPVLVIDACLCVCVYACMYVCLCVCMCMYVCGCGWVSARGPGGADSV